MRTVQQIVDAARARATEFGATIPTTHSVMFQRVSVRQQDLFGLAAQWNPEYYALYAIATLDDPNLPGGANLRDMFASSVLEAVLITGVWIEDKGTSAFTNGDAVTITPASERPAAFIAPRATVLNHIIQGLEGDLDDVAEIKVRYSYRPDPLAQDETGTTTVGIEQPYDELLVVDLARDLARKTVDMEGGRKKAIVEELDREETALLASYAAQVRGFLPVQESRYHQTQGPLGG